VTEPTGKAAILYLIGECGDMIHEAPYALEKLIDTYEEITDVGIKTALLTTTVKLFFM
jgi:AP-4 complex subunit beta-1